MNMIQSAKDQIAVLTRSAYRAAVQEGLLPDGVETVPAVEIPKDTANGDYTTTFALAAAKALGKPPRVIAQALLDHMDLTGTYFTSAEIAGPGFLNVTFSPEFWRETIRRIDDAADRFGQATVGKGCKVQVEYVSANPTGPLHIGHGRGAAVGDTLARILRFAGYDVTTEYYINDAGRQMRLLGLSIWLRAKELAGIAVEWPEDYYRVLYH